MAHIFDVRHLGIDRAEFDGVFGRAVPVQVEGTSEDDRFQGIAGAESDDERGYA